MSTLEKLNEQGWYLTEDGLNKISESGKIIDIKQIIKKALDTDLRDIGGGGLPLELNKGGKIESISGNIVVQILKIRNISAPRANEESKVAPRFFKLQITDGLTQYSAIEIEEVPCINFNTAPGTKLLLRSGTINISQGLLLLNGKNVSNLGGKVASLYEKWDFNRALAKYAKGGRFSLASAGPPPWIPFGQKIQQNIPLNDKSFKSLSTEAKEIKKENSEFNELRKDAIAEASKVEAKKVFGGGSKLLVDANVQKIMDSGFSENEAKFALKLTHNNVERALSNLKRLEEKYKAHNDPNYKSEKYSKKSKNESLHEGQKPSGKISLYEFLEDKLPQKPDSASSTTSIEKDKNKGSDERKMTNDMNRFENNISASFASRNKSDIIPKKYNNNNNNNNFSNPYKSGSALNTNNSNFNNNNTNKNASNPLNNKNNTNNKFSSSKPISASNEYNSSNSANNINNSKYPKPNYYDKQPTKAPRFQQQPYFESQPKSAPIINNTNKAQNPPLNNGQPQNNKNPSNSKISTMATPNYADVNKKINKNNSSDPNDTKDSKDAQYLNEKMSRININNNNNVPANKNNNSNNLSKEIFANGVSYNPYEIMGFQNKITNEFAMNVLKGQNPPIAGPTSISVRPTVPFNPPAPAGPVQPHSLPPNYDSIFNSKFNSYNAHQQQSHHQQIKPALQSQNPPLLPQQLPPHPSQHMAPQHNKFQQHPQHFQSNVNMTNVSSYPWKVGDKCLAKYWEDERFYNAQITAISEKTYVVMFMEYGNYEEVLKTDIVPLGNGPPISQQQPMPQNNNLFGERKPWVNYNMYVDPNVHNSYHSMHPQQQQQQHHPRPASQPPHVSHNYHMSQQMAHQSQQSKSQPPQQKSTQQQPIPPIQPQKPPQAHANHQQPRQSKYREQAMYVPPAQRK